MNRRNYFNMLFCCICFFMMMLGSGVPAIADSAQEAAHIELLEIAKQYSQERYKRRAHEVAIWGYALVAGDAMVKGGFDAGQKLNQVAYLSKPPNWKFQGPTPNNSTLYVQLIFDIKDGPVVVELPPTDGPISLFGSIEDVWQRPVVDVGAQGDDAGQGGKYYLYNKRDPQAKVPEGYLPVPLQTYRGYATIRVIIPDYKPETLERGVALVRNGIHQYPYGSDIRHPHLDVYDKIYSSLFPFDHTFYLRLQEIINHEEVQVVDKYAMGMLSSIGIERGGSFNPTDDQKKVLDEVMQQVYAEQQLNVYTIPPLRWGDKTRWTLPVPNSMITTGMTYEDENKLYIDDRAYTFYTYISPPVKLGKATAYLMLARDEDGGVLDGESNYTLTVPANPPAEQFWSVLVYDVTTGSYIREADPIGLASLEKPELNEDGSYTLYFGPKPLNAGVNYLPTGGTDRYFLLFRFYGPTEDYRNNSWMLNDMKKLTN